MTIHSALRGRSFGGDFGEPAGHGLKSELKLSVEIQEVPVCDRPGESGKLSRVKCLSHLPKLQMGVAFRPDRQLDLPEDGGSDKRGEDVNGRDAFGRSETSLDEPARRQRRKRKLSAGCRHL